MALTGDETFGTVVPGFVTDADGHLVTVSVNDGTPFGQVVPGFLTDIDGRLYVSAPEVDAEFEGGFLRNPDGGLAVEASGTGLYGVVPGFAATPDGALSVEVDPVDAVFECGFMRSADALAITLA